MLTSPISGMASSGSNSQTGKGPMKLTRHRLIVLASLVVGCWSFVESAAAQNGGSTPVLSAPPAIGEMSGNDAERIKAAGYVQQEFFLEGTARSYVNRGEWKSDGVWDSAPAA